MYAQHMCILYTCQLEACALVTFYTVSPVHNLLGQPSYVVNGRKISELISQQITKNFNKIVINNKKLLVQSFLTENQSENNKIRTMTFLLNGRDFSSTGHHSRDVTNRDHSYHVPQNAYRQ